MQNGQRCTMNRRMLTDKENPEAHAMDKRTGICGQVMKGNPSIIEKYTHMQAPVKTHAAGSGCAD